MPNSKGGLRENTFTAQNLSATLQSATVFVDPSFFLFFFVYFCGGAVASRLVRSFPDRAVRVRALAGNTVLSSWARHLTRNSHSASLHPGISMSTGKLLRKPNKLRGSDLRWTSIPSRGSRNTPSRFMLQKLG